MYGGERGEVEKKTKVWRGGVWSLVRIHVWDANGGEMASASAGLDLLLHQRSDLCLGMEIRRTAVRRLFAMGTGHLFDCVVADHTEN